MSVGSPKCIKTTSRPDRTLTEYGGLPSDLQSALKDAMEFVQTASIVVTQLLKLAQGPKNANQIGLIMIGLQTLADSQISCQTSLEKVNKDHSVTRTSAAAYGSIVETTAHEAAVRYGTIVLNSIWAITDPASFFPRNGAPVRLNRDKIRGELPKRENMIKILECLQTLPDPRLIVADATIEARQANERRGQPDSKSDNKKTLLPKNSDVLALADRINHLRNNGRKKFDIAVEYCEGDEKMAKGLLRQLQPSRFGHLLTN